MGTLLALAMSLCLEQSAPQENLIHLKSCQVTLAADWIILDHSPNGSEISRIGVLLPDATGQPRSDKSLLMFGICDVSTHAGLTVKELLISNHKKAEKQFEGWEVFYKIEAKRTDYALVIDAFRYVENSKVYLWARRGRTVKEAAYTPTDADFTEVAPYLKRITIPSTP